MSYDSKQMQGGLLAVLISLSAVLLDRRGDKVLWQPYHQHAEETQLVKWAASVTQIHVQACVCDKGASADMSER